MDCLTVNPKGLLKDIDHHFHAWLVAFCVNQNSLLEGLRKVRWIKSGLFEIQFVEFSQIPLAHRLSVS